jgi:hypothetical protein
MGSEINSSTKNETLISHKINEFIKANILYYDLSAEDIKSYSDYFCKDISEIDIDKSHARCKNED